MPYSAQKNRARRERGFSLIEVVISTAIISAVFVVMMGLFTFNLQLEINNRNKIIASYLAQEALEIVKQKRDTNWFSGASWNAGLPVSTSDDDKVLRATSVADLRQPWSVQTSLNNREKIVYLCGNKYAQTNVIAPAGCVDTGFRRTLTIRQSADTTNLSIRVRVTYRNATQEVLATSYLYKDWGD